VPTCDDTKDGRSLQACDCVIPGTTSMSAAIEGKADL
jgi:hypothetical protein